MEIGMITKNGKENGDAVILFKRKEGQDLMNILTQFCEQNPRKKTAKNMLKELEDNMCIW